MNDLAYDVLTESARKRTPSPENSLRSAQIASNLFTIAEFCSAVRISARQFHRMRSVGDGPCCVRLGGKYLISRNAMENWIRSHEEREPLELPPAYC